MYKRAKVRLKLQQDWRKNTIGSQDCPMTGNHFRAKQQIKCFISVWFVSNRPQIRCHYRTEYLPVNPIKCQLSRNYVMKRVIHNVLIVVPAVSETLSRFHNPPRPGVERQKKMKSYMEQRCGPDIMVSPDSHTLYSLFRTVHLIGHLVVFQPPSVLPQKKKKTLAESI